MIEQDPQNRYTACPDCDLLLYYSKSDKNQQKLCPRCHHNLQGPIRGRQYSLAFALSALIFFIPANLLPLMEFSISGQYSQTSLPLGIYQVWQNGYYFMATMVGLCSVFAPLAMSVLIVVCISLSTSQKTRHLMFVCLSIYHSLKEWAMLEVYCLGLIVAYIKLNDLGTVTLGAGLGSFILTLLCLLKAMNSLDTAALWESYDE